MNPQEAYEKFKSSRQQVLRLEIALSQLASLEELSLEQRRDYEKYLKFCRKPALEYLIKKDYVPGLKMLGISDTDLPECLRMAAREGSIQVFWYLMGREQKRKTVENSLDEKIQKREPKEKVGTLETEDVWKKAKRELCAAFPFLGGAIMVLETKRTPEIAEYGTDGIYLYESEKAVCTKEGFSSVKVRRAYFHMLFHCMFLHIYPEKLPDFFEKRIYNLSCDICVEFFMDSQFTETGNLIYQENDWKKRQEWYRKIQSKTEITSTESIGQWILSQKENRGLVEELERVFISDDHRKWYENPLADSKARISGEDVFSPEGGLGKSHLERLRHMKEQAQFWKAVCQKTAVQDGQSAGKRGNRAGNQQKQISLLKKKKYDYRTFLRQFAVFGEEVQVDEDQFDYIPYTYSRSNYDKIVFLEPLEYTEVHKLQELVIAIDTSGSCRGSVVRQFMEETYQILSQREHFFKKMRIHLIQCDSMIQEYICIEGEEQWKEYLEHLKIQGYGGTDFRPVFELIEKLRRDKEIQEMKGLLYFTDGDGVYPRHAPDYTTAFIFLNKDMEKQPVPSWAVKLNLEMKEIR